MNKVFNIIDLSTESQLEKYEARFKALADKKRLQILNILTTEGETCVCDLSPKIDMPQSKLSYHLKMLLDNNLIQKEKRGTWNYYSINPSEINHLLSEELCCLFRPGD
ncbi:ArsR/SmtB family transcription factor [Salinibacillus xinjiangensis]|uniref:Metalloregulator ArsR/SmtB family transcription factor n=1 Tax=Salinibacillus xinjiangensis TaxID=1229268 RepID=A0A6G1X800_9BACI|nr:metalloregulator ArsR/SmtB family transcription factor [Salinibacillus xinjiangensis]MRG87131.1 metalloregulator ArsR/SmtB family transcription factor [Salinibacillus xinjiangensis]